MTAALLTLAWIAFAYVCLTYRYGVCRLFGLTVRSHPLPDGGFWINDFWIERSIIGPGVYAYRGTLTRELDPALF